MTEARIAKGSTMLAATGFIVAAICQVVWSEFFAARPQDYVVLEWFLRLFRDVAWMEAACVLVMSGIALSQRGMWHRHVLIRFVPGLAALIVPAVMSAIVFHTMQNALDTHEAGKVRVAELAVSVTVDKNASLEARFVFTQTHALQVWKDTGKSIDYFDESGNQARFVPDDAHRMDAAREGAALSQAKYAMDAAMVSVWVNLLFLVASVVVGILMRARFVVVD